MVAQWHVASDAADGALDDWDTEAPTRGIARDDPRYWSEGETCLRDRCGVSDAD